MNEQVKITASYEGGNLNSGLQSARTQLAQTAVAAQKLDSSLAKGAKNTNQAGLALTNLGRVAQDVPFGFVGIQNNLNPLLESFTALKAQTGSSSAALKALGQSLIGPAGLGLALSLVSSAIVIFQNGILGFNKKAKEAKEASDEMKKAVSGIFAEAAKEETQVLSLIAVLNNETETRNRKLAAIKELQKINPEVFKGIQLEGNLVTGLDAAYQKYIENLRTVIAVKIKQQQLEKVTEEILRREGVTQTKAVKDMVTGLKKINDERARQANIQGVYDAVVVRNNEAKLKGERELNSLKEDQLALIKDVTELSKGVSLSELKVTKPKVIIEGAAVAESSLDMLTRDISFSLTTLLAQKKLSPEIEVAPKLKSVFSVDAINEITKGLAEEARKRAEAIRDIVEGTMEDAFTGLGESLGNIITGSGGFGDMFQKLFSSFGSGLKQLGAYFIKTGIQVKVFKEFITKNPVLAIAAGIALTALGSVIQAATAQRKAFATGVRGFDGGVALVGERGPELVQLPRGANVIPNAQSNAMMGTQEIFITGEFKQRGNDLVATFNRASATIRRNA